MKIIRNILYTLFLICSVIACSDDDCISNYEGQIDEDEEFVSLSVGVNVESANPSTRSISGPLYNYIYNRNPDGPVALEVKVTYEDKLKAFYINNHSYGNMITPLWDTEDYENIKTDFSFALRCPKRWDPSKIRIVIIGKAKYFNSMNNSLKYNYSGRDDSRVNLDCYTYYNNENSNRIYFLADSLSNTNDWSGVKTNFVLKNITSKIIILSDEYKEIADIIKTITHRRGESNYIATHSILESNPGRNILDSFYTFTYNNSWSFWKPNGYKNLYYDYDKEIINYYCDIHNTNLLPEQRFTAGGLSTIPGDTIKIPYSWESRIYNFDYKGRKVSLFGMLTITLGANQSLPKIAEDDLLWDQGDAGKDIEYLRMIGNIGGMNDPSSVTDTLLLADGVVPLPENMKPNHIYVISNKPNTRFLNYSIITGDDRTTLKPLLKATGITRGDDNYIVEEYDMNGL